MRNLRSLLLISLLILASCAKEVPVPAPAPESFCAFLLRTEDVKCEDLLGHAEGDNPNVNEMYAAYVRGRVRMAKFWPEALNVKMGQILFYRPKRYFVPEKPYPLINGIPDSVGVELIGGVTSPTGPVFIRYAYEYAIEHETAHAIGRILFQTKLREIFDVEYPYLFQILCHGTLDDPLGIPGKRDSCDKSRVPYIEP